MSALAVKTLAMQVEAAADVLVHTNVARRTDVECIAFHKPSQKQAWPKFASKPSVQERSYNCSPSAFWVFTTLSSSTRLLRAFRPNFACDTNV